MKDSNRKNAVLSKDVAAAVGFSCLSWFIAGGKVKREKKPLMWLRKHRMAVTKILYVNHYVSFSYNLFPHNSVPSVLLLPTFGKWRAESKLKLQWNKPGSNSHWIHSQSDPLYIKYWSEAFSSLG